MLRVIKTKFASMNKTMSYLGTVRSKLTYLSASCESRQQLLLSGKSFLSRPERRRSLLLSSVVGLGFGYLAQPVMASLFPNCPSKTTSAIKSKRQIVRDDLTAISATTLPAGSVRIASSGTRLPILPARSAAARVPKLSAEDALELEKVTPPRTFLRTHKMLVTAYTPIPTRMEGGRETATLGDGRAEHGVAVDPSVIRLGSRVWVPGYGHAVADDTGGRIKGRRLDVRVQEYGKMDEWGVRRLRVYVLEEPE